MQNVHSESSPQRKAKHHALEIERLRARVDELEEALAEYAQAYGLTERARRVMKRD